MRDEFEVVAVPEPSSVGMALAGMGLLVGVETGSATGLEICEPRNCLPNPAGIGDRVQHLFGPYPALSFPA